MKSRNRKFFSQIAAAVCVVMLLAGCGDGASVHTGAEVQTEDDAYTAMINMAEPATGDRAGYAGAEPAAEDRAEDAGAETAAGDKSEDEEVTENTARDTVIRTGKKELQEQTSASRAQMEIDEETKRELTEELLEEENLDTSVMESGRATKGCTFELPEGFEESEEAENVYVTKRYPIDASVISYIEMEEDISQQLLTEENFKDQTEESLKQIYDEDVALVVDSFEHIRISGYPAFRILCHYHVDGVEMTQLEYAINADKSYMIIYSQTGDYDYMEAYEASADTIQVN